MAVALVEDVAIIATYNVDRRDSNDKQQDMKRTGMVVQKRIEEFLKTSMSYEK